MSLKVIINAARMAVSDANEAVKITVLPAVYAEGAIRAGTDFASRDEKALRYAKISRSEYRYAVAVEREKKR